MHYVGYQPLQLTNSRKTTTTIQPLKDILIIAFDVLIRPKLIIQGWQLEMTLSLIYESKLMKLSYLNVPVLINFYKITICYSTYSDLGVFQEKKNKAKTRSTLKNRK